MLIHTYIHTYIHTCTHRVILYEYIHLLSGVHTQSYYIQHNSIHSFIHIYTYIRTYIHTYIHTYIYFHTVVFSFSFLPFRFIAAQSQIRFCLLWMIAEYVYVFILKYLLTTFFHVNNYYHPLVVVRPRRNRCWSLFECGFSPTTHTCNCRWMSPSSNRFTANSS